MITTEEIKSMSLAYLQSLIGLIEQEIFNKSHQHYSTEKLLKIARSNKVSDKEALHAFDVLATRQDLNREQVLLLKEEAESDFVKYQCGEWLRE